MSVLIPLRNSKRQVVAHAIVDDEDAERVNQWPWCLNPNGYAWRSVWRDRATQGKHVYLHRLIAGATPGDGLYVDHINRQRMDNRRANLRLITPQQAAQNKPALKGRYRGVSWDKARGKWTVKAQLDGRMYHLGRFDDEVEANRVAVAWREQHMPFAVEET